MTTTKPMIYRCSIAPCDGLRVQQDGQHLSVCVQFGNGISTGTPVMLDKEQARRLALDLLGHVGLDNLVGTQAEGLRNVKNS